MWTLWWLCTAGASTLTADAPVSGPTGLADVAAIEVAGTPLLARLGTSELSLVQADGTAVLALPSGGAALLVRDQDGDGVEDLLVCSSDGIEVYLGDGTTLAGPTALSSTPCVDLLAHALDGSTGVLVHDGSDVWRLDDDGSGGFSAPTGTALASTALLWAAEAEEVAVASVGDTSFSVLTSLGTATEPAGGTLVGLAAGFSWLTDDGVVRLDSAEVLTVSAGAVGLWWLDVDGDGSDEVLVHHPDDAELALWSGGETRLAASGSLAGLLAIDLDGDGCDDLVWGNGDADASTVAWATCGTDAAETGETETETETETPCGERETCNGVDDDCDGYVDEAEEVALVTFDTPYDEADDEVSIEEGDSFGIDWVVTGCADDVEASVTESASALSCSAGPSVWCRTDDDVSTTLTLTLTRLARGAVLERLDIEVRAENVDPELIVPSDFPDGVSRGFIGCGGTTSEGGETYTGTFRAWDAGEDELTFSAQGGTIDPLTGEYSIYIDYDDDGRQVTVTVDDDDGGSDRETLSIVVESEDDSGCCGSVCFLFGALPLFALFRRRG